MKKILYLFLVLPLLFSSCAKEEGCKDPLASNYNADAEEDDGSCMYDITGVWTGTSAILNGQQLLGSGVEEYLYIWADGDIGGEVYVNGLLTNYSLGTAVIVPGDPNVLTWAGDAWGMDPENPSVSVPSAWVANIDKLTNANNMTWRAVSASLLPTYDFSGSDSYVKTYVRCTTCSLNDWK